MVRVIVFSRLLGRKRRASRTAPGVARIYLPGEPEMECRSNRLEGGTPIETDLLRELETLAGEAAA